MRLVDANCVAGLFSICTYYHADVVLGVIFALLYGVVEHNVHEGIESAQDAGDSTTAI